VGKSHNLNSVSCAEVYSNSLQLHLRVVLMKITTTGRTAAGKIKQDCMIYDGIRGTGYC
jgi:hypothetical protein